MSSSDRLAVLRERNKELLVQLRQRGERLQNLTCNQQQVLPDRTEQNQIHVSLRGSGAEETMDNQQPEEMVTLFDGDRGSVRAALSKPSVSFVHNETSGADGVSRGADLLQDGNKRPSVHRRPDDTRQHTPRPHLLLHDRDKERRETANRVTFQSPGCEQMSASHRQYVQPLLGYDWIAGILDVESSLVEHSDEFFNDLLTFRSVNQDECVHSQQEGFPEDDFSVPPLLIDEAGQEAHKDTHQCTFCYRINSRLFPIPLDPEERCPVCKKPKSLQPHTAAEPAFIRVSIPCSTLLPTYKYKPHRRCSFDPSDSLGLPSHCLSGWSNTGQSTLSQPSTLDLRSNLNIETSAGRPLEKSQNKDHLDLPVSGSQRADKILDVSRLARYRFQHPTI